MESARDLFHFLEISVRARKILLRQLLEKTFKGKEPPAATWVDTTDGSRK